MTRNLLIIVGVIVLFIGGFVVYTHYFVSDVTTDISLEPREDIAGKDIIDQLSKLPSEIKAPIFSDIAYEKLKDGTVELQDIPVGKNNPFAPIFAPVRSTGSNRSGGL